MVTGIALIANRLFAYSRSYFRLRFAKKRASFPCLTAAPNHFII